MNQFIICKIKKKAFYPPPWYKITKNEDHFLVYNRIEYFFLSNRMLIQLKYIIPIIPKSYHQ